jgi:hypothetical protein
MKKITLIPVLILSVIAFKTADDIITKMGLDANRATWSILTNVINAQPRKSDCSGDCDGFNLQIPKAALLADVIKGDKTAVAKEVCAYIKQYCESKEFHDAYQKERASNEPRNEQPRKIEKAVIDNMRSGILEMEKNMKELDGETKKMYAGMVNAMKVQLKELSDPLPQTSKWKEKYPASTDSVITRALTFYLAEQATVDFTAQTTIRGNKKYFVDPRYEKERTRTWKTIYRAGREVNAVVKEFVTAWLKQGVKKYS